MKKYSRVMARVDLDAVEYNTEDRDTQFEAVKTVLEDNGIYEIED